MSKIQQHIHTIDKMLCGLIERDEFGNRINEPYSCKKCKYLNDPCHYICRDCVKFINFEYANKYTNYDWIDDLRTEEFVKRNPNILYDLDGWNITDHENCLVHRDFIYIEGFWITFDFYLGFGIDMQIQNAATKDWVFESADKELDKLGKYIEGTELIL